MTVQGIRETDKFMESLFIESWIGKTYESLFRIFLTFRSMSHKKYQRKLKCVCNLDIKIKL